ncbi:MAG: hypothetical protein QOK48_1041 [Blastocatellia bacterium]|nr:hypothetical protein [Blastocatellia bacterium]
MDHILTLLSKPIVLTLVTLTLGSYLFTKLTERRSKREKIREKALQLLEDVGSDLNGVISLMYRHIRTGNFKISDDSPIFEKRGALFAKRFSVRIRSKVFLESEDFWYRYGQLTFEIDKIVKFMASIPEQADREKIINTINDKQKKFAEAWPCEERLTHSNYAPPAKQLVIWVDMVWDRSNWLISTNLNTLFR